MDSKKNVTMPMVLAEEQKTGETCTARYNIFGKEIGKECYPETQQIVSFAGLKRFSLSTTAGITETFSYDEKPMFEKNTYNSCCNTIDEKTICPDCRADDTINNANHPITPRSINSYNMRVGYAGDAVFLFHEDFAHFILP